MGEPRIKVELFAKPVNAVAAVGYFLLTETLVRDNADPVSLSKTVKLPEKARPEANMAYEGS